ncbi:MAG TPA: tetratricopeptide repeat protein, partial [Thermoanaerobaculia bacterium]|nr:tetratricopeptide repeat protein [Thermoanaerobaculia bacterium]
DYWPLGRLRRETAGKLLLEKIPLLLLIPVSAIVTVIAQKSGGAVRTLEEAPLLARLGNAAVSYAVYLLKTIWPANLAPFYPWKAPAALAVAGSILLLAAITALAIRARKTHPWLLAGWLWYLGTLVPVIGIVQVGEQSLADRYTYLPLIGIFAAIVWGGAEAARAAGTPFSLRAIVTAVWILILMVVASRYAATWRSSIEVWSRSIAIAERPTSDMHLSLGLAYAESGRIPEALDQQRKAVELDPKSLTARLALATTLKAAGDFAAAAGELEAAKRIDPKVADVHNNLGNAYDKLGDVERAEAGYREALRLDPRMAEAHMNLGTLLSRRDDARGAAEHYGRALAIQPASIEARVYFALALWNAGDRARSVEELQRAGAMDPAAANGFVTKALRMPPDPRNLDNLLGNLRGQL